MDLAALAALYSVMAWAVAAALIGSGYVDVSIGDTAVAAMYLFLACGFEVFSPSVVFLITGLWVFREFLHRYLFSRIASGRGAGERMILAGLGVAILLASLLELFGMKVSWRALAVPSILQIQLGADIVLTSWQSVRLAGCLVAVAGCAAIFLMGAGRLLPLIRDNRQLSIALGLPVRQAAAHSRALASVLACVAAVSFFVASGLRPSGGLEITVTGFIIAAASGRSMRFIPLMSLLLAGVQIIVGGFTETFWARYVALLAVGSVAILNPETRRMRIVDGPNG